MHPTICEFTDCLPKDLSEIIYDHHAVVRTSTVQSSMHPALVPAWLRRHAKAGPMKVVLSTPSGASVLSNLAHGLTSAPSQHMTLHIVVKALPSASAREWLVKAVQAAQGCSNVYTMFQLQASKDPFQLSEWLQEESDIKAIMACVGAADEVRVVVKCAADIDIIKTVLKLEKGASLKAEKIPRYSESMPYVPPGDAAETTRGCPGACKVLLKWTVGCLSSNHGLEEILGVIPPPTTFELTWGGRPLTTDPDRKLSLEPSIFGLVTALTVDCIFCMDDGDVKSALTQCKRLEKLVWKAGVIGAPTQMPCCTCATVCNVSSNCLPKYGN